MGLTKLVVRGARQHNLKNISLEIPRNTLTVITGLSGSGKSSLAFDTIYAEGQRRYVESLSAYARQFLDQMERPDVDVIEGLSPSIAIEQKTTTRSEEHTSELQSRRDLVCRLLLEKKKKEDSNMVSHAAYAVVDIYHCIVYYCADACN